LPFATFAILTILFGVPRRSENFIQQALQVFAIVLLYYSLVIQHLIEVFEYVPPT